ncbi:MAG TPA: hypothetical protein VG944_20645 [Fimbriimonas sp.]|nr:hypothetical protein [Fimbriimonas sp.]
MINHIVTAEFDYTVRDFAKTWAREISRRFQTIHTHLLAGVVKLPAGAYLFTDMERQAGLQRELQAQIYDQLAAAGDSVRLLNHPTRSLMRFDLLTMLYEKGINPYRCFRGFEIPSDLRFPAFVRQENDHHGSRTPLLHSWSDLEEAFIRLSLQGIPTEQMLTVEFCDVSQDGLYVKYAAQRIGDRVINRHVLPSTDWIVKGTNTNNPEFVQREIEYVHANPHEEALRQIFDLANIQFGRLDYSFFGSKIVVWEINTNPSFFTEGSEKFEVRLPVHIHFAERAKEAFLEIDVPDDGTRIPIELHLKPFQRQP